MQFLNVQLSFVGGLKRQKIATWVTILWEHLLQGHVLWFWEDHKPDHETPEGQFCRRHCCCSEMTWLQHSFRPSTESLTLNQSYLWQWNLTLALSSCRAVCCQSCLHHTNQPSAYVLWPCVFFFFFVCPPQSLVSTVSATVSTVGLMFSFRLWLWQKGSACSTSLSPLVMNM